MIINKHYGKFEITPHSYKQTTIKCELCGKTAEIVGNNQEVNRGLGMWADIHAGCVDAQHGNSSKIVRVSDLNRDDVVITKNKVIIRDSEVITEIGYFPAISEDIYISCKIAT